ncbi:unnamed protein product [Leptidea sinapis]|uniref:Uncharacterized protein n=1 Tax=Leptidea sinapis TaxID=189913 RepID=A0A5E4R4I9_9NEOP|nr:unnamed protein product [Leptidea sinapis]
MKNGQHGSYVRTRLTYAAPSLFALRNETGRKSLRAQQLLALRTISGAPRFVRNQVISRDLRMESLDDFVWGSKFGKRIQDGYDQMHITKNINVLICRIGLDNERTNFGSNISEEEDVEDNLRKCDCVRKTDRSSGGCSGKSSRLSWWGSVGAGAAAYDPCMHRAACWPRNAPSRATRKAHFSGPERSAGRGAKAAALRPARGTPCRCAACTGGSPPPITLSLVRVDKLTC